MQRDWVLEALAPYWSQGAAPIAALPTPALPWPSREPLPPRLARVALPSWAAAAGVEGALLVPHHRIARGPEPPWVRTDWIGAAFWYLAGLAEREHERVRGPVHSYARRLQRWDTRLWERAWVNRIALFLRRWAARLRDVDETTLFGPLPAAEAILTHDVDVVRKTAGVRVRHAGFLAWQAARAAKRRPLTRALPLAREAAAFLVGSSVGDHVRLVLAAERQAGVHARFFFYAGAGRHRGLVARLFDPAYDIRSSELRDLVAAVRDGGGTIGLHPSFESWRNSARLAAEKARLEAVAARVVTTCRQHWLRFSWRDTWAAQQAAGLGEDATLGFNDRAGFRCGAALRFHPWNPDAGAPLSLRAVPLVLMDSHLYDAATAGEDARIARIAALVAEVRAVGGTAAFLWHPHTLSADYGWHAGFQALLRALTELS